MSIEAKDLKVGMTVINPNGRRYTISQLDSTSSGIGVYNLESGKHFLENRSGKKVKYVLVNGG
jgi:translation elongation factor P/translation initiation factor 5A